MIVDLFAGPGGWSEGLRALGCSEIGIELDEAACKTARAAGHKRVREDVSALSPSDFAGAEGLIASAPCPTFSGAGRGAGRLLTGVIVRCMDDLLAGSDRRWDARGEAYTILEPVAIADERAKAKAKRRDPDIGKAKARARRDADTSLLVVEPLRWALAIRPVWIALEQVREVLGLWEHMARLLRTVGYEAWTGKLEAERYGVPQTRERAILMAHRDRPVHPPVATHQRYVPGEPQRHDVTLEGEVLPWVSMAEALSWTAPVAIRDSRSQEFQRGDTPTTAPAPTLGSTSRQAEWVALRAGTNENGVKRPATEPAPTIRYGARMNDVSWVEQRPAPTIVTTLRSDEGIIVGRQLPEGEGRNVGGHGWTPTHYDVRQTGARPRPVEEPAPAMQSQGLAKGRDIWTEGDGGGLYRRSEGQQTNAVRVTEQEAAILQSFRPDYPWAGSRTKRFEQIGNAVPPLLAEAVLRCLVDVPAELAEAA